MNGLRARVTAVADVEAGEQEVTVTADTAVVLAAVARFLDGQNQRWQGRDGPVTGDS